MKTSNLLLGLWVLLVAGLALIAVYFLRSDATTPPAGGNGGGVVVDVTPDKPKPPKPHDRGTRADKPDRTTPAPLLVIGRVLDGEGKPVAGAVVRLLMPAKPTAGGASGAGADVHMPEIRRVAQIVTLYEEWADLRPLSAWTEAPPAEAKGGTGADLVRETTDADGAFRMTLKGGMGRGPFRLSTRVDAVGSASATDVYAGQNVDLILATGGVVTGKVIKELGEDAVAGAKVVFDSGETQYTAVSDAKGEFRIEAMPPGRFTLRAGAKGLTPILDQPVQVVRGEPVTIKLPHGTTLRIKTILNEEGTREGAEPPIPNVEVVALEETTQIYVIGTSNDYGLVEFAGLPAGSWIVNGRVNGFVSEGDALIKIDARQEIVEDEVTFESAVDTPLKVVDETGLPLAGVEFFTSDGSDSYDAVRSEKLEGKTDAQGEWKFPFEFDGPRCMLFGFKKGYGFVHAYPDDYSGGDPIQLVMKKAVRVFGRVTDEQGTGVPNAVVRMTLEPNDDDDHTLADSVSLQLRTDTQGRYDFPYVPEGYEVSIEAEDENEDAWSDDMPTVEQQPGVKEYEVNLRLETGVEPVGVMPGSTK